MDSLIVSPCILICIEFLYFVEADLCKHIVYCNIIQVVILLIPVHLYLWYVLVQSDAFFSGLERGLRCKVFVAPLDPNHKSDLVKDCIQVIQLIDGFKCLERKALHPVQRQFLLNRNLSTADLPSLLSICRSNFHEFDNVNRVTALVGTSGSRSRSRCTTTAFRGTESATAGRRLLASWPPVLDGIALRGVRDIEDLGARECTNFFWACGKILWKNIPLLEALSLHAEWVAPQLLPQHLGNIAWRLAK